MTNEAANGNDAQDVTTAEERINDPAAALPTGYEFPAKNAESLKLALFSEGYLLRYNTRASVIELQRTHLDSSGRALRGNLSRIAGPRACASGSRQPTDTKPGAARARSAMASRLGAKP